MFNMGIACSWHIKSGQNKTKVILRNVKIITISEMSDLIGAKKILKGRITF